MIVAMANTVKESAHAKRESMREIRARQPVPKFVWEAAYASDLLRLWTAVCLGAREVSIRRGHPTLLRLKKGNLGTHMRVIF